MEGDQSPTPTKAFKEDLMDAIALDQDGTQSLLPSSTLESFQDMDLKTQVLILDSQYHLHFSLH